MKFATCNEYFESIPIEDVFNYAADLGYDGVEIAPFTLAPSVEDISAVRRDEIRATPAFGLLLLPGRRSNAAPCGTGL